jgi:hypothetical protein
LLLCSDLTTFFIDALLEHSVLVSNAIAPCWIVQRRKGIQETRSKTTQASVTEGGITLFIRNFLKLEAKGFGCLS